MAFTSSREKRLWSAAGLCLLLIYSSLYIARPIAEYLRERNLLRLAVAAVFLIGAGVVVWRVLKRRPSRKVVAALALVGAGYLVILTVLPLLPEERLHFFEYGLVAVLLYGALRERRRGLAERGEARRGLLLRISPFVMALVLVSLFGWLDEGIQAVLPNRVYDLRDVAFNMAAGVIGLLAVEVVEWAQTGE